MNSPYSNKNIIDESQLVSLPLYSRKSFCASRTVQDHEPLALIPRTSIGNDLDLIKFPKYRRLQKTQAMTYTLNELFLKRYKYYIDSVDHLEGGKRTEFYAIIKDFHKKYFGLSYENIKIKNIFIFYLALFETKAYTNSTIIQMAKSHHSLNHQTLVFFAIKHKIFKRVTFEQQFIDKLLNSSLPDKDLFVAFYLHMGAKIFQVIPRTLFSICLRTFYIEHTASYMINLLELNHGTIDPYHHFRKNHSIPHMRMIAGEFRRGQRIQE